MDKIYSINNKDEWQEWVELTKNKLNECNLRVKNIKRFKYGNNKEFGVIEFQGGIIIEYNLINKKLELHGSCKRYSNGYIQWEELKNKMDIIEKNLEYITL